MAGEWERTSLREAATASCRMRRTDRHLRHDHQKSPRFCLIAILPSSFILLPFLGGRIGDIAVYGQESNSTTRRLAMMNLAIRGIEGDLGPEHADTFRRDLHKDLKADYVLANPPFNDSAWHRSDEDVRWKYDVAPKGNSIFPECSTSSSIGNWKTTSTDFFELTILRVIPCHD